MTCIYLLKKRITGGISSIAKDIVKQITNAYIVMITKKTNKYITYLDANNLYG